MKKMKKTGFTLFELLVSISIIGILIAIASFSYSNAQKKARDAKRMQDINAIHTAAEQFYSMSNSVYPTSLGLWGGLLQQIPTDPKGTSYSFTNPGGSNTDYCVCALLESGTGNSGLNCASFGTGSGYFCALNQQ